MPIPFATTSVEAPNINVETTKGDGLSPEGKSNVEIPFSAYSNIKGHSYSSEYFEIDGIQFQNEISTLESYIMSQITEQGLNNSIDSYRQVLNDLFSQCGLTENHQLDVKFNKIVSYIGLLGRNKSREERKEELLKRAEEVNKQREEARLKALEENYLKVREAKSKINNEYKTFKSKVEKSSSDTERVIKEINDYRSKIEKVLSEKNKTEQINKEQIENLTKERAGLIEELRIAKINVNNLIIKHRQLKSLIN